MKCSQLYNMLKQLPLSNDILLQHPIDPQKTLSLDDAFFTYIRTIDPPSHLILTSEELNWQFKTKGFDHVQLRWREELYTLLGVRTQGDAIAKIKELKSQSKEGGPDK